MATARDKRSETSNQADSASVEESSQHYSSRKDLLVALLQFQIKLLADGLRDLILSPLSFIATLLGLMFEAKDHDRYFQRLMELGRRSDRYINLFNQHPPSPSIDRDSARNND